MPAFDNEAVDRAFFSDGHVKSDFICALRHGDPGACGRLPRLGSYEVGWIA